MQSFNANAFGNFKYFHRRRSSSSAVRLRPVSMLDYISLYLNNFVIDENLHRYCTYTRTHTYISYTYNRKSKLVSAAKCKPRQNIKWIKKQKKKHSYLHSILQYRVLTIMNITSSLIKPRKLYKSNSSFSWHNLYIWFMPWQQLDKVF